MMDPNELQGLEFAPWDGRRVPVTLIGGYLGAGKTTVINELLARTDRPIAVLVNDVGSVNVDAALIRSRDGDTIELTEGCVCCSLASGLVEAFDQLRARDHAPDHVIVEMSGVADPLRVVPWASSAGFRLDGVVVLVDAEQLIERDDDPVTSPYVRAQIQAADLTMLTKVDLVPAATLEAVQDRVISMSVDAPMRDSRSSADIAAIIDIGTRRAGGLTSLPQPQLFDAHDVSLLPFPPKASRTELDEMLRALPERVVRAKGIALGTDGERFIVQKVGRRHSVEPLPQAEDQAPTGLVVISVS